MFDLSLEMLRVVEDAALASARTMGMGDHQASDQAAERLWAEVLNLGAFDLLPRGPFDREEVLRVVENARWASDGNAKYASPLIRRPPERAQGTNSRKLVAGGGF